MAVGYVYLMTNGKDYKIGLTASEPQDRQRQLQTGNSEKIDLIAYTICKDMNGLEYKLHKVFTSKRKNGEWFNLDENELNEIFNIFTKESINLDMSHIPEIITDDVHELMKIDGKRLAEGKNTLHDEKYNYIDKHEEILIDYMIEEESLIKKKFLEQKKNIRDKEKIHSINKTRMATYIKWDAMSIAKRKKPLHTLKYKNYVNWKKYLNDEVLECKNLLKIGCTARNITENRRFIKKYIKIDEEFKKLGLNPIYEFCIENLKKEQEKLIKEKEIRQEISEKRRKERLAKEKEKERLEKERIAKQYIVKDAKRILVNLEPIYQKYYVHIFNNWNERLKFAINKVSKKK